VEFLEDGGASVGTYLRESRIDPGIFRTPESFMSLQQAIWLVDRAGRREGIEDLGLRVGASTTIRSLGLFGEVLAQSLTLRDLIRKVIRWSPALNSGVEITLVDHDESTVELRLRERIDGARRQTDDYSFMLLLNAVRLALGPEWRPREVLLHERSCRLAPRLEALSEARCLPNPEYTAMRIPRDALDLPLRDRLVARVSFDPESCLERTSPVAGFEETLALVVESMLGVEPPTIDTAAEIARISVRTLQRRLAERATTFEEVVDRLRFEKALNFLENPDWKLGHVASCLGYSDPANFSRAFRRWTGSSPGHYRMARRGSA
jgi:AraC-like DNA-binding protein